MTKIKLCGMMRREDIAAVNELHPDYIGFIFAPKSRRYISPEQAREFRTLLAPDIQAVGVFVNECAETIVSLAENGTIDVIQLHGSESEEDIHSLRKRVRNPVIQAIRMEDMDSVKRANASSADYVLLDAGSGGTGTVFDWTLAAQVDRPCFLAGGLDPQNVTNAIRTLHPFAVDVSSGIETKGAKDRAKMFDFVNTVRQTDREEN